ncbi:hypothetical protein GCM10009609_37210 [Pseudonocardia aurantiaca]|uniref:Enoyl-CoA hydratase-related protein n=1 Tax=Pseudonocardia aurantiaca TaxID=75290 RepID=A0ABW4FMP3_9PSEU
MGDRALLDTMVAVQQPIVAAVHGYALGLGATIALFSEVVIAEDAAFADTHVNVGSTTICQFAGVRRCPFH